MISHRPTSLAFALAVVLLFRFGSALSATFPLPPAGTDIVGEVKVVRAKGSETLLDIARRYGLGYGEMTAANPGVDPWVPGDGTQVVLPTEFILPSGPRRGIVLNLAQLRLFYFPTPARGKPAQVITQPVGIGTDYASTPLGETRIVRKAVNPVWRPSRDIREEHVADGHWLPAEVPPGPENPLGKFALYLALKGNYLIHGTNKPWGVGMRVSHGCIRLFPEGIESLYSQVPVGTAVRIVDERALLGMRGGELYLQAYPSQEKRFGSGENESLTAHVEAILRKVPRGQAVDWDKSMELLRNGRALPVPITPGSAGIEEVIEEAVRASGNTPDAATAIQGE
ncbi:MAG TPA: L,D-transpeptidase family protein [Burkholderiales bacterium]|nr:L,D-transpeptidase family protein [Burkholderiales bacterium]